MLYKIVTVFQVQTLQALVWMLTSFIGPQILNFKRSLSLSPGPKEVLFRRATFLLEAPEPPHVSRGKGQNATTTQLPLSSMATSCWIYLHKNQGSKDQHPKTKIKLEYTDVRNEKQQWKKKKIRDKHL